MDKTSLGDRMKKYERAFKFSLPQRMPLIIRVDGKAFHTYTKGLKPFDKNLRKVMDLTALKLCEEIQGAQLAYVQSDEISLLVHNYKRFASQGWFDNELQKICSVSAAIASATFTNESVLLERGRRPAFFDSRAFILPENEVNNYFIWRQQDWIRNSVQMLAYSLYSHRECYKKNNSALQEMCFQKGKNWNNLPPEDKRGRCVVPKYWLSIGPEEDYDELAAGKNWCSIPAWEFKDQRDIVKKFLECDE